MLDVLSLGHQIVLVLFPVSCVCPLGLPTVHTGLVRRIILTPHLMNSAQHEAIAHDPDPISECQWLWSGHPIVLGY